MKCQNCGKEATVEYCDSSLDYSHGFTQHFCRQCYVEKIEKHIRDCQNNLKEQKKLLKEELKGGKTKDE